MRNFNQPTGMSPGHLEGKNTVGAEVLRTSVQGKAECASILCQRAWVEVDQGALSHNVRQLRQLLTSPTQLMAVVKADAYGHGATLVARTALDAGAAGLCVATLQEGIQLREAGIEAPILLLGAVNTPEQVEAIAHWQLEPTICNPQQALIFSETLSDLQKTLPVPEPLPNGPR